MKNMKAAADAILLVKSTGSKLKRALFRVRELFEFFFFLMNFFRSI